ncbi:MAG: carboxypeptidase-like regulatory domain-containing protein, partial [Bacteroidota bacterium]
MPKHYLIFLLCVFSFTNLAFAQQFADQPASSTPLSVVLADIEHDKGVSFLYAPSVIAGKTVSVSFKIKGRVGQMLKRLLPPLGLRYEKVGRRNYVLKRDAATDLSLINTRPKELQISGRLTDEQNEPLAGGTLLVLGTDKGTVTDGEGFFRLTLPNNQATIRVSYLGYKDQLIQINKGGEKDIQLSASANTLTEVVVTALGISKEKKQLAFAADNITTENLSQHNAYSVIDALTTQSPGLWTNSSSGSPGASTAIRMRGFRSINGANQPLFILDGMPIDNTSTGNSTTGVDISNRLIDINIQDIEKVSILRGASAAALYGIRAANGAIVITSKRGREGTPQISFSTSVGVNQVSQLPARQKQYSQGVYTNGVAQYRGPESNVNTSYGPLISELEFDGATDYPYDQNGRLVPLGMGNGMAARQYDPYGTFFVNGWNNQQHLSVSGGNQLLRYFIALGHVKESGVVPGATYERSSLKGVFEFRPHQRLSISVLPTLALSKAVRMKKGSMFSGIPLALFRTPNTFDIGNGLSGHQAAKEPKVYELPDGRQRSYRANGSYDNPFWAINHNPYQDRVIRNIQQITTDYDLGAGWSLT